MAKRLFAFVVAGIAAVTLTTTPGFAASKSQAQKRARAKANAYIERFGISGRERDWTASCSKSGSATWNCRVSFNGGQCSGSVKLRETAGGKLKTARIDIACGE